MFFQESLVTPYNEPPPPTFIRHKLARLLFKQKNREFLHADDNVVDLVIHQNILLLKEKDKQTNVPRTDHVYIECLIRADFNDEEALDILCNERPNLVCLFPIQQIKKRISVYELGITS